MLIGLVLIAGLWAGLQNALAGGGSFVTLPVLMMTGMSPLAANITSTLALFPGQVTSGLAGRRLVTGAGRLPFWVLFVISIFGGALGGLLLLKTPSAMFSVMVPWLVLFATSVFAWGSFFRKSAETKVHLGPVTAATAQFVIAIYGGYRSWSLSDHWAFCKTCLNAVIDLPISNHLQNSMNAFYKLIGASFIALTLQACAVVAVADAAVTVVATGVKVTAKAVGAVASAVIPGGS